MGRAPASGLGCRSDADPAELLLDLPRDGGQQPAGFQFGQGDVLLLREAGFAGLQHGPADGILADRASALRRSSTALVKNLPDIFTIYKRFRICVNNVFIPQKWLKA